MDREPSLMPSLKRLRYVPLFSAGVLVFLGLVFLGDLSGLLWHIYVFTMWVRLSPSVIGPRADWVAWAASFLLSISPGIVLFARTRTKPDLVVFLAFLVFPALSLVTMAMSYFVGATMLVGSGFLAVYALVSRAESLIGIERDFAARLVCTVVFVLLTAIAAGGVISILIWNEDFLFALISGSSLAPIDISLSMLGLDVEVFYLARPVLSAVFVALAFFALIALFRDPLQSIARSISRRLKSEKTAVPKDLPVSSKSSSGAEIRARRVARLRRWFPYAILAVSVGLGVAITLYPYTFRMVGRVLGSDSWFYLKNLESMNTFAGIIRRFRADRGFFLLLLFAVKTVAGKSPELILKLIPPLLSALLALSTFVLVREGTDQKWVAAFAALLSVVSAQTAIGMSAGIITNWFALSVANFMFALIIRSVRRRSKLAAIGSLGLSLVLLVSYSFMWVVVLGELAVVLVASILRFRTADRRDWKYEVSMLGSVLVGSILIPVVLLFLVVVPVLGFHARGLDPQFWLALGWKHLIKGNTVKLLKSAMPVLEKAFDFAGNRIDLPFLTLLSIIGLLDTKSETPSFRSIVAAMVLVPFVTSVITPDLYLTWRGLYIVPLYLTGALGAASVIRRVNGLGTSWKTGSRLAFAGAFTAYVFVSQLSYSLRALELLIIVGSR